MERNGLCAILARHNQQHLLHFYDELTGAEKAELTVQLGDIDFDELNQLIKDYVLQKPAALIPADLRPAPFFPLAPRDAAEKALYAKAVAEGEKALRGGEVACLTVAGGQGTRLGYDAPKGTYPICPVSGKSLFEYFAGSILRTGEKYGCKLVWYIMTSTINNQQTVDFFEQNNYFGLRKDQVFFFVQGTMPAIGHDGKLLRGARHSLSLSPNGHGGTLLALRKSGALDKMKQAGVKYISYFQVDNPLVSVADPLFIGLHALEKSEMSAIMLSKTGPFEKLGNFCVADGKLTIIEYSDLPADLAESRNADGSLKFIAGSPAIHVISRDFVEKLTSGASLKLPYHRADKKVSFVNDAGESVNPAEPNAVKLETFIFDALSLASKTMVKENARAESFAPTKNATGVDSVESCRVMMMERDAKRLEKAGVAVPRKADGSLAARIEISPRAVLDEADAAAYVKKHNLTRIEPGSDNFFE